MSRSILLLLTVAGLLPVAAAADQSEYARGSVLDTSDDSFVQRVAVPDDVYEWVLRRDLGDLRVFNRSQEEMPYNVRRPARMEEFSPWQQLPLFPLPGRGDSSGLDPSVRVEVSESGAIIAYQGGRNDGEDAGAYLVDASALDRAPTEIRLDLGGTGDVVSRVSVETSDDLNRWQPLVADITIARLDNAGHQVGIDEFELPRRQAKYLRIRQIEGAAPLRLDQVEVRHRRAELPQRRWRSLDGTQSEGGWEFASGGWYPVDRLKLTDAEGASFLATVRVYSRMHEEDAWRDRGLRTFYRSLVGGVAVESAALAIDDGDRFWRLEFEGEGLSAPRLNVGWLPDEVVFLKQGAAPYVLAYGQAGVEARQWPLTELLRQLNGSRPPDLAKVPFARVMEARMLGGPDRLIDAADPIDWRTIVLWLVLVAGVLAVGTMAYRLLRT
jgi:hypothetical protein